MTDFCMPSLGADMEAGTLVEWRVAPGANVGRGDVVALVETDKGLVEVEIWESGVVESLAVAPGTKVPVGAVLATLQPRTSGGAESAPTPPSPAPAEPVAPLTLPATPAGTSAAIVPPPAPTHVESATLRVMASPAAKQLARERGIELATVHGTGPHGSITRADVDHASNGAPPKPAPAQPAPAQPAAAAVTATVDTAGMRRAIAAAMARSKREIPHYYLSSTLDVGAASAWLATANATRPINERVLFATLLLKATALAVREVPEVNGFFVNGEFRASKQVHLGVAVSMRQGGLVAPAIHDVDTLSLTELQTKLRELVSRARAGRLRSSEMSDPTLTVTNLGEQGVEQVFGVIYPPQVALIGFGKVIERPCALNGLLGVRPLVVATLAADHRVSDGHRGATFLGVIARLLERPENL